MSPQSHHLESCSLVCCPCAIHSPCSPQSWRWSSKLKLVTTGATGYSWSTIPYLLFLLWSHPLNVSRGPMPHYDLDSASLQPASICLTCTCTCYCIVPEPAPDPPLAQLCCCYRVLWCFILPQVLQWGILVGFRPVLEFLGTSWPAQPAAICSDTWADMHSALQILSVQSKLPDYPLINYFIFNVEHSYKF